MPTKYRGILSWSFSRKFENRVTSYELRVTKTKLTRSDLRIAHKNIKRDIFHFSLRVYFVFTFHFSLFLGASAPPKRAARRYATGYSTAVACNGSTSRACTAAPRQRRALRIAMPYHQPANFRLYLQSQSKAASLFGKGTAGWLAKRLYAFSIISLMPVMPNTASLAGKASGV